MIKRFFYLSIFLSTLFLAKYTSASDVNVWVRNDNLWICTSTSCALSGSPTGNGNLIIENKLGVAKFVPSTPLDVYTTSWGINFSSSASSESVKLSTNQVASFNTPLYLNSSTNQNIHIVTGGGNVGVNTTNPRSKLEYNGTLATPVTALSAPITYWRFDESSGTNVSDSGSSGATGIFSPNGGWFTGSTMTSSNAGDFNGSRYVVVGHSNLNSLSNFTIMAWVKKTNTGVTSILSKLSNNAGYALVVGASGEVICRTGNGTSYTDSSTAVFPYVTANTGWNHLTIVKNGTACTIYINGANRTATSGSHTLATNIANVIIGAHSTGTIENFAGQIDDVRVYNYALTQDQVTRAVNVSIGSDMMVRSMGATTSIYSYGRICASNNPTCTGGTGTLINGNVVTADYLIWNGGPQLHASTNVMWLYPPSVAYTSTGIAFHVGNGSNGWNLAGALYQDLSGDFGLLNSGLGWATRIPGNTNWLHFHNTSNSVGAGTYSEISLYVYRAFTASSNSLGQLNILSSDGNAWMYINDSNSSGSSTMNIKRGGNIQWEIYNRSSDNSLNIKRRQISSNSYALTFGAGTGERVHDLAFGNNVIIPPGVVTTNGVYTQYTGANDTWFRLVQSNARTTYHALAIGQLFAGGAQRFDIAEITPVNTSDKYIVGNLVGIDPNSSVTFKLSQKNQLEPMGIVSDINTASLTIGGDTDITRMEAPDNQRPIALRGRVITLVSLENGDIKSGDLLTQSSKPGVATKKIGTGHIVSIAMESLDGSETNSLEVKKIINKLKSDIKKFTPDTNEYKQLNTTINQLTQPLPSNTGRIISFLSTGISSELGDSKTNNELSTSISNNLQDLLNRVNNEN